MSNSRAFSVTSLAVAVVSVGAIVWASYGLMPSNTNSLKPVRKAVPGAPTLQGVLGLDAESLAAAGVSPAQAELIYADLREHLEENGADLMAAVDQYNTLKKASVTEDRAIRAGKTPDPQQVASRRQALANAENNKVTRVNSAVAAATARLPGEMVQRLAMINANRSREVPAAYRLVERTDAQWIALRDALSAERQATQLSQAVPDHARTILADVRAEAGTAAALQNRTNLAAIEQAIAQ